MKKFGEYIIESLAAEVKSEPQSQTAVEARRMGLTYMGFGRYADSKGQLAYIVDNNRLIPYKRQEEIQGMYKKAQEMPPPAPSKTGKPTENKAQALVSQADMHNKVMTKRSSQDQKIIDRKMRDAIKTDKILRKAFPASMFDENELAAMQDYTNLDFEAVNRYLYKGFDQEQDPEEMANIERIVADLDSAFSDAKAPISYTVYSGLSSRYTPDMFVPGESYVFRGYVSTTLDYNTAIELFTEQDDNSVVLQIEVTKGQSAIHVSDFSNVNGEMNEELGTEEMETLLPRGSKIRVISGPHVIMTDSINQDRYGGEWPINIFHCMLED